MLELLRQQRTNEQIAEQLGITLDGAKYHVSSILSKLGVTSREEAAAWAPREARRWTAMRWALPAAGAGVIIAAVASLAVLALGLWLSGDDEDAGAPVAEGEPELEVAFAGEDGRLILATADGRDRRRTDIRCDGAIYWSPAGERLGCASGENDGPLLTMAVVDLTGNVLAQFDADGGSFTWAPGSNKYAYTRSTNSQTDLYWGESSSVALASNPVWLPDGRLAAYRPTSLGPEPTAGIDIYTGNEARFLPVGEYRPLAAVREGQTLLVAGNYNAGVDLSGPTFDAAILDINTQQVTAVPALNDQPHVWVSLDGRYGVFLALGDSPAGLLVIDFESLDVTPIGGSTISYPGEGIPSRHISVSPDNSAVYWADVKGPTDVYRAAIPSASPEKLGSLPLSLVEFSPDFTRIAYIGAGNPPQLWIANIDGSNARSLGPVLNAFAWRPKRSADGESRSPSGTTSKAPTEETFDLDDFLTKLADEGLGVSGTEEVSQPFLSISGTAVGLRDYPPTAHGLNVFIYPTKTAREDDTARLGRDLTASLPLIEWIAPAYGLSRNNVFVVAVTDDVDLLARIERALEHLGTGD